MPPIPTTLIAPPNAELTPPLPGVPPVPKLAFAPPAPVLEEDGAGELDAPPIAGGFPEMIPSASSLGSTACAQAPNAADTITQTLKRRPVLIADDVILNPTIPQ